MTHPANDYELDHAAFDFAREQTGGALPGEDDFDAWYAFYLEEGGDRAVHYSFYGIFPDDIEFTKEMVANTVNLPSWIAVDYERTSLIVTDYLTIDLPYGRKAYFR